jgi:hypothetical protein
MAVEELGRAGGLVLAHHVGRRFPGVLIQGDTLLTLMRDLEEEAPRSAAAERVREWVAEVVPGLVELEWRSPA